MAKIIVEVIVHVDTVGKITPLTIIWEDGRKIPIDRVIDVRRAASLKAGGTGIRYTCMIQGHQRYLFNDRDIWFVEGQ